VILGALAGNRSMPRRRRVRLLDALPDLLARCIPVMPRGADIDEGTSAVCLLGDVCRHVERAHVIDERSRVTALSPEATNVGEQRTITPLPLCAQRHQRLRHLATTMSPFRFSMSAWPMKLSPGSLPGPFCKAAPQGPSLQHG
jgi:hypothetical protein